MRELLLLYFIFRFHVLVRMAWVQWSGGAYGSSVDGVNISTYQYIKFFMLIEWEVVGIRIR